MNDRLRIKIEILDGQVIYFVVQYETLVIEKWQAVVRYDMAHGFFHKDTMNPKGEETKEAIEITGLKDALSFAQQDLRERWLFYKSRFLKDLK